MTLIQDVQCFSFRVMCSAIVAAQLSQCNTSFRVIWDDPVPARLHWPSDMLICCPHGEVDPFRKFLRDDLTPTKKIFLFNIFENIDIVPWVGKIRRSKGYLDIYRISSAVLFKKGFSPHQRSSLWNTSLYLIYAFVQNNNCSGVVNIPHDVCNVDPQNCIRHCGQFIDP